LFGAEFIAGSAGVSLPGNAETGRRLRVPFALSDLSASQATLHGACNPKILCDLGFIDPDPFFCVRTRSLIAPQGNKIKYWLSLNAVWRRRPSKHGRNKLETYFFS
jgi:hypothetical protein